MLNNSNVLAFIGTGESTEYPKNQLVIWNASKGSRICNITFNCHVISIKLKHDRYLWYNIYFNRIFVVCERKIFVHSSKDFKLIDTIETAKNVKGGLIILIININQI